MGLLRLLRIAIAVCCLALLSMPRLVHAQDDASIERLRIHGSNTLGARLVPAMVEAWLHDIGYSDVRRRTIDARRLELRGVRDGVPLIVEIDRSGSASGFQALIEGNAEIAMMARAPDAAEREAAWQLGDLASPEQEFVITLDGIAVVVNERNTVRRLSVAQLRDVLAGRIQDWSQLGGSAAPIHVHVGPANGGQRDFLRERVTGRVPLVAGVQSHASLAQAARAVANDASGLAVIAVRTGVPRGVRTLAISDGGMAVLPTRLNVMSEDYPLVQRYRLYGGPLMSALGRSFAQYSVTRQAQRAAERAGFMAVTLRPAVQSPPSAADSSYVEAVAGAERLPISLRFNPSSMTTFFDSRSANDLERVVAYLRLPQNRDRHAVVVGFAHGDGNTRLITTVRSNERADLVADYLIKQGIAVRRSIGMGASRALGDSSSDGRLRNERVEIWLQRQ